MVIQLEGEHMSRNELMCDCDSLHQDIVEKVKKKLLDELTLTNISNFYKVLGDETRMKIINVLNCSEMCVCDICVLVNMTKSAVSHQLKKLKDMNIVKSKRVGKEVFYRLSDSHVKKLFEISLEHVKE